MDAAEPARDGGAGAADPGQHDLGRGAADDVSAMEIRASLTCGAGGDRVIDGIWAKYGLNYLRKLHTAASNRIVFPSIAQGAMWVNDSLDHALLLGCLGIDGGGQSARVASRSMCRQRTLRALMDPDFLETSKPAMGSHSFRY